MISMGNPRVSVHDAGFYVTDFKSALWKKKIIIIIALAILDAESVLNLPIEKQF